MTLRSADELLALARRVLDRAADCGEAEVRVTETASALTRFANSAIHQNVADTTLNLRVRIIEGGRSGVAEAQVGEPDGDAVERLVTTAEAVRADTPAGDVVHPLSPDRGADSDAGYCEATAAVTPEERADAVAEVCAAAAQASQRAFGTYETALRAVAMASTTGLARTSRQSTAELIALTRGDDGSAYAARTASDARALDAGEVAREVTERCRRNQNAMAVEPGEYEVILSPYAVFEMLEYLSLMGLGGLAMLEQRSFMRIGERLMSDRITVSDDVSQGRLSPLPFDGEGATTRPVTLIDRGVCAAVVHDSVTAARAGTTTTGHSFPQPNSEGPFPHHLCLSAGDDSVDSMVRSCKRGLMLTRLWYVRAVHPLQTIITGMTRDGTFLVEQGRVVRPVRDLRFTQSVVAALSDVRGVGSEHIASRGYFGAGLAPWLHLGRFAFTS